MSREARGDELARLQRENAELGVRLRQVEQSLRARRGEAAVAGDPGMARQELQAALLDRMDAAVVVLDTECRTVYLNPAAARQYGVPPSAALGQPLAWLYTAEWSDDADAAAARRALQGPSLWRGRHRHRRRDGSSLLVESTLGALRDARGQISGSLVLARDVSAPAACEAALREIRARRGFELASSRHGEWELDLDSGTMRHSPSHDRCFGYAEPPAAWSLDSCLHHVHELDRMPLHRAVAQLASGGGGEVHLECRVIWPDTSQHWIEFHAARAVTEADSPAPRRLHGTVCDITARKQAEAALRDVDRRQDEFLALLAHELRNPLAPIRNATRILQLSHEPQVRGSTLALLERQLDHLVRLLDDLVDASRISRGDLELQREPLSIDTVLDRAIDSTRPLFESKQHRLALHLPPSPAVVDADLTRLTQVMVNLLDNAARFTPRGGHVAVSVEPQGETVLIRVQDDGIGIDADMLPRVFDMFTRVKRHGGADTSGLGIGLALVRRLVELHGGSVRALSAGEWRGATLELRLPLSPALPTQAPPAPDGGPAAPPASAPRRVLVAEDNPDSASSMVTLLQLMGHETAVAGDGPQAVARAQAFRPQIVLMDIGLPGFDGYEAARRIRSQEWGRDMLLVALTGWGQDADRARSHAAGLDQHLVKPVDPRRLEALLQRAGRG